MLRLDTVTTKLQAFLAGAVATNNLPVYVAYSDASTTGYLGAKQRASLADATAVDIGDAPAASVVRDIEYVSIHNADTAPVTVTVRINDNGAFTILYVCTLEIGERLEYVHGAGFRAMTSGGATKSGSVQDLSGYQLLDGFADGQVPTGSINDVNAAFTLAHEPSPAASLHLFRNGVRQTSGADYTLVGSTITYFTAPSTGDTHVCDYRY